MSTITYAKPVQHGTVTVTVISEDRSVREDWRFDGKPYPAMAFQARFPRLLAFRIGRGLRGDGYRRVRAS